MNGTKARKTIYPYDKYFYLDERIEGFHRKKFWFIIFNLKSFFIGDYLCIYCQVYQEENAPKKLNGLFYYDIQGGYRLDVKFYCFHFIVFLLLNQYKKVCLNVPEILITWN